MEWQGLFSEEKKKKKKNKNKHHQFAVYLTGPETGNG